jgi:hypothetical protein
LTNISCPKSVVDAGNFLRKIVILIESVVLIV